jgi:hypothetical protein
MTRGVAIGFAANVLLAVIQGFATHGDAVGGLWGQAVNHGAVMAVTASRLLAKDALPLSWVTGAAVNVAAMLYGISVSCVSGILLGMIALLSGHRSPFVSPARYLHPAAFPFAAAALLLLCPARRNTLQDSLLWKDGNGSLCRFAQETACALRRIAEHPWLGIGSNHAQKAIDPAAPPQTTQRPLETSLEESCPNGWLFFAMAHGLPATLALFMALLLACFHNTLNINMLQNHSCPAAHGSPKSKGLNAPFLLLLLAMGFTPFHGKGAGLLLGLAFGQLWGNSKGDDRDDGRFRPLFPWLFAWLCIWMAALAVSCLSSQCTLTN